MDFTSTQPNFNASSSSSSITKLPIKRKTHYNTTTDSDSISISTVDFTPSPSPLKFQRLWTEPDEIRFLQGLITSTSDGLSLSTFYNKFSNTTSHPYSKTQLAEKLRRLRKKFRVISSRIARGLNFALLSPHDRSLFNLSKKLWSDDFVANDINNKVISNNNISGDYAERVNLVGVKVNFSPVLPAFDNDFKPLDLNEFEADEEKTTRVGDGDDDVAAVAKNVVAKSVLNVFDECLKEVIEKERLRCVVFNSNQISNKGFERKWKDQKFAEIDALARRLRLVVENSVNRQ